MRRRQAKKIIRREAARYLAIAAGAEESGDVDPKTDGPITIAAMVGVMRSDIITLRGLRKRSHDDWPRLVEARLHGVPARLLFPEIKFLRAWRGPKRSRLDTPVPTRARARRRLGRLSAGELALLWMPNGQKVRLRRHVARGDALIDGVLEWHEHAAGREATWWDIYFARSRRERRDGRSQQETR